MRGTVSPRILVSSSPVRNLLCSVIIEDSLGYIETIRLKLELIRQVRTIGHLDKHTRR